MFSLLRGAAVTFAVLALVLANASTAFAASAISITTAPPSGCQLSTTAVTISGSATADAPPGQLQQYAVDVDWGDGAHTTPIAQGDFGSGQGTFALPFTSTHTYTVPGTYHVIATVYHQNLNGQDNVSSGTNDFVVCIVSPLTISKTANTSLTRTWTWGITKTATTPDPVVLASGEQYSANYTVSANATPADSDWAVGGNISITNPVGNPAITVTVTDAMATDGAATVVCPTNSIAAGATVVCTYSKSLGAANNQVNTATVVASEPLLNGTATANVDFTAATVTKHDDCAVVSDTNAAGPQGVTKCSTDTLPAVWNYSVSFGKDAGAQVSLACGDSSYPNTASFVTNTSATTGSATKTINFHIDCPLGCTLTQGYWKTHNDSFKGGAPTDTTWNLVVSQKEQTLFYTFGASWFKTFWTPPTGGNAYYQLAHQYMAAKLNQLKGTTVPPAVQTALNSANTLFNNPAYTPAYVGGLKGSNSLRAQ
jgi:hypothetical protein